MLRGGSFDPPLRQKVIIDPRLSDKMIFAQMELGDTWIDSGIHMIWKYIYSNKHLRIPDSWVDCIRDFDNELTKTVL